jgi:hypothetical protein
MPLTRGKNIYLFGIPKVIEKTDARIVIEAKWYVEQADGAVQFLRTPTGSRLDLTIDKFVFGQQTFVITMGSITLQEQGIAPVTGQFFDAGQPKTQIGGAVEWPGFKIGSFSISPTGRSCGLQVELLP